MSVMIINGDCRDVLRKMDAGSVNCCVTSPPYFGLRDYQMASQIGLEDTPDRFVTELVDVFRDVKRVLRDDGTFWLIIGDSYVNDRRWRKQGLGLKPKDLIGIPWRVAFALQQDGWYLRSDIIWHKSNPMPESVTDRPTSSHEHMFFLTKSERYFYDAEAIKEPADYPEGPNSPQSIKSPYGQGFTRRARKRGIPPRHTAYKNSDQSGLDEVGRGNGRNKRDVWTVATKPFRGAHFATFPPDLIEPCILAGCPLDGVVIDPFAGAGTTGLVADRLQRNAVLIELNPDYVTMAADRINDHVPLLMPAKVLPSDAKLPALALNGVK